MNTRHTLARAAVLAAGFAALAVVPAAADDGASPTPSPTSTPWTALDHTWDREFNPIKTPWATAVQPTPAAAASPTPEPTPEPVVEGQRLAPVTAPTASAPTQPSSAPTARRAPRRAPSTTALRRAPRVPSSTSSAPRRAPRVAGPRATAPRPPRATGLVVHLIRPGQTLTSIGAHYRVAPLVIASDNRDTVTDPDVILAGATLRIRTARS